MLYQANKQTKKTLIQSSKRQKNTPSAHKSHNFIAPIIVNYSVVRATFIMKGLFPGQKKVVRNIEPSMQTCGPSIHTGKCSPVSV